MSRALVVASMLAAIGAAASPRAAHADDGAATAGTSTSTSTSTDAAPEAAIREGEAARGDDISATRRLAAIGAALVPGVLVHGAGSWVIGEKRTAKRLAVTGWIGLGALAIGGAAVGISGGAPAMVIWGVPMIIAGAGLAFPTWFADIWHAAGGPRVRGEAHAPSAWSVDVGTTWLHDAYRERALLRGGGRVEIGRFGVGASGLVDAEGHAWTGDVEGRVRIFGAPADGATTGDGSRLYVRAAVRRHVDDDDMIAISTVEAEVGARADLARLDANLAGSFVDVSIGMGVERVRYADTVSDDDTLFLGRFAWGLYLGRKSELSVFYDHRRDSLAGGIAAGRAAGFVGSVGTTVELRVAGPFAVVGELEIGNGWVTTAGVRYHGGPL